jgi:hypothetical protein
MADAFQSGQINLSSHWSRLNSGSYQCDISQIKLNEQVEDFG